MSQYLPRATLDAIRIRWVDELPRTHFEGCFLTSGHAGCAIARLLKHIEELETNNTALRGEIAKSAAPCIYCSLPANETGRCKSGFPGCGRMDDILALDGCSPLESTAKYPLPPSVLEAIQARIDQTHHPLGNTITEWDRQHLMEHIRHLQSQEATDAR